MTVKLYQIPDLETLYTIIANAKGRIDLLLSDQKHADLRSSSAAWSIMGQKARTHSGITLALTDYTDYLRIVNYVVGAAYAD